MKRKGFTLVELLVVIAIIALLMGILMPALARVRQLAFRMVCGTNLSGIGKAMLIYANDYDDEFPRAGGKAVPQWAKALGNWTASNRRDAYSISGTNSMVTVSSSLYLLVKYAEVTPKSFLCKSDSVAKEFKLSDYPAVGNMELIDVWDFGGDETTDGPSGHCSYAYHVPAGTAALSTSSDSGMAVAGDRNPWQNPPSGKAKAFPGIFDPEGTTEQQKYGNATAHQEDGQNVLFLDSHVKFEKRTYCAIDDDNVYTPYSNGAEAEEKKIGNKPSLTPYTPPGDRRDSFLVNNQKGRTCFPAETVVCVDGALVRISTVDAGQQVSRIGMVATTLRQIECVQEHEGTFECYDLVLENGNCISVAGSHLFLVDSGQWVPVQNLRGDMELQSAEGLVGIRSVSKRPLPYVGKVYNLKIEGGERYLVGEDGLVVRDW